MKTLVTIFLTLSFTIFIVVTGITEVPATGQTGGNPVSFGERPPIDYSKLSAEHLIPGIIRIKFKKQMTGFLDHRLQKKEKNNHPVFGLSDIDILNDQFNVTQTRQTFYIALQDTAYDLRHREWGLHLWYDLFIPEGTDLLEMLRTYAELPEIEHAEPVFKKQLIGNVEDKNPDTGTGHGTNAPTSFIPNDPLFSLQWHYHNTGQSGGTPGCDIKLPEAWDIAKGNSSVIVAVIDGGIDYTHQDLAGNMWSGIGYNFATNSTTITVMDHATHIAGTIAANTNNGIGVSGIAGGDGTGNGVRLMSCEVYTSKWGGSGFETAPVWAADHGAAITQNSWVYQYPCEYDQAILDGIDYFVAHGGGTVMSGGLVCFAAGNGGSTGMYYPGCYSKVIGVAATNNQDKKAEYSVYDTWVDIAAPGGDGNGGVYSTDTSNTYMFMSGTSMACPHVSGTAALVVSLAAGHITAQDAREILLSTADNINTLNPAYVGMLGSGRINAYAALQKTQAYLALFPPVSLTTTAINTSRIDMGWSSNAANDSVMLAFNITGTFGNPVGNYQPGQGISGGGTVLYKGKLNAFHHTGLNPATTYYYALWTKNGNNYSVIARKEAQTTVCNPVVAFPWHEGFENNGNMPVCWREEQVDSSGVTWQFIKGDGFAYPAGAFSGSFNACLSDASATDNKTRLETPCLNLLMLNNPKLKFYHTQQVWGTRQDELRVFYKNSPTGNWNLLASYTNSINAWKADSINLPSPSSTYFIAFEGNARYGLGVCIDEVSVTGQSAIKTLNLTVLLEGLYAGGGLMNPARDQTGVYYGDTIADKITIELHNAGNYSNLVYVATDVVLSTNGTATTAIPGSCNGSYYITVKHRNSIETTSANPVSFSSGTISYNFTNAVNKAYGNNLMQTFDGKYVIYGGDVNVDSQVDALDMLIIDNLSTTYTGGYIQQDVNGDGIIDSADMSIISTNCFLFIGKITP